MADAADARSDATDAPAPACTLRCILLDIAYSRRSSATPRPYRDRARVSIRRFAATRPTTRRSTSAADRADPARPPRARPRAAHPCARPPAGRARRRRSCGRTAPTSPTRRRSSTPATCCSRPAPSSRPTAEARDSEAEFADDYVRRLRDAGVAALGFGTEVIRAGTPDALVEACARQGLPLFEVPYRVPFIAIARLVADLLAEDAYARQAWALAAQRAISLAALRPDGLSATLAELSNRLGAWVGLIDAAGSLDREAPDGGLDQPALGEVVGEARSMLRRGQRASRTLVAGESVGSAAARHPADPRRRRRPARRARDRRLRRSSTRPAARSSPRSSRSPGSRSSRTATSTGPAGTCARACFAASSRATPSWPSGSPPRCGVRCPPRRSGSR